MFTEFPLLEEMEVFCVFTSPKLHYSLSLPLSLSLVSQKVTLYGSRYVDDREPVAGEEIEVDGMTSPAVLNEDGIYFFGSDGKKVQITECNLC